MKMTLLEERIELNTRYGKLLIPLVDVRRIDFGFRLEPTIARRVEAAIADLGHPDYRRRLAASEELTALDDKAYPALVEAAKQTDPEAKRRAEDLVDRLRKKYRPERLEVPAEDVVHTESSKIAGRITTTSLRVKTFQFGELQLKLADVRGLRTPAAPDAVPVVALPDPGNMSSFQPQVGKAFVFQVTGLAPGAAHRLWGTGVYTHDSTLAAAAVHAGVLRSGEAGQVRVTVVGPQPAYVGSTQNGFTSSAYGGYNGYRIDGRADRR
jgi:hypothetical protein